MDVNDLRARFKSRRITNPLMPSYLVRDEAGKVETIGEILGNTSVILPPERKDEKIKLSSLKTQDIAGCKVNTVRDGAFHSRERRQHLKPNRTDDIFGAEPGSLRKAPLTKRSLHPLMPDY